MQTCVNLITNQEYAVKVSTSARPAPRTSPCSAWALALAAGGGRRELAFELPDQQLGAKLVSKNGPRASDSGHPWESRSACSEPLGLGRK